MCVKKHCTYLCLCFTTLMGTGLCMFTSVFVKICICKHICVSVYKYASRPRDCMYLLRWARSVGQESYFSFHVKPQKCSTNALMCVLIRIIVPKNQPSIISKRMTDGAVQRLQAPESGEVYSNLDGQLARGASFSFLIIFYANLVDTLCACFSLRKGLQQSSFCFLSNLLFQKVACFSCYEASHNSTQGVSQ